MQLDPHKGDQQRQCKKQAMSQGEEIYTERKLHGARITRGGDYIGKRLYGEVIIITRGRKRQHERENYTGRGRYRGENYTGRGRHACGTELHGERTTQRERALYGEGLGKDTKIEGTCRKKVMIIQKRNILARDYDEREYTIELLIL